MVCKPLLMMGKKKKGSEKRTGGGFFYGAWEKGARLGWVVVRFGGLAGIFIWRSSRICGRERRMDGCSETDSRRSIMTLDEIYL
jgi:hypothetical protein